MQVRRAALLLGDAELANDVVHEAFVSMFERWPSIDAPGPYLHRSVLNGCRDSGRRRQRMARLIPRLVERGAEKPVEVLWDVLATLPFNQRAVVVLKFYESLTEAEIASLVGCPTGSVGPWTNRALSTMRKALQ